MASAFLMVPKKAVLLVCEGCRPVVEGNVADAVGPDTLHAMPCDVIGVTVACEACGWPITDSPEGGLMH